MATNLTGIKKVVGHAKSEATHQFRERQAQQTAFKGAIEGGHTYKSGIASTCTQWWLRTTT